MNQIKKLFVLGILCCVIQNGYALVTKDLTFKSFSQAEQELNALSNCSIVSVNFQFDPYSKNLIRDYLSDGYITVNNQHDMNELIAQTYFDPVLRRNNLNVIVIDLNALVNEKNPHKIEKMKDLIEKLTSHIHEMKQKTYLGLKFNYTGKNKQIVDELWTYTSIPILINGIHIVEGYKDFLNTDSNQKFLKKIKYLRISSDKVGAEFNSFNKFLQNLKFMKNLELLDLHSNSIGSIDTSLNQFFLTIKEMNNLKYLDLQNNLVGAYQHDADLFIKSTDNLNYLEINLSHNLTNEN